MNIVANLPNWGRYLLQQHRQTSIDGGKFANCMRPISQTRMTEDDAAISEIESGIDTISSPDSLEKIDNIENSNPIDLDLQKLLHATSPAQ